MKLPPGQRLALIDRINSLVPEDFERLVFALKAPRSVLPSRYASPEDRSAALLAWVESPGGCGLDLLLKSVGAIASHPSFPVQSLVSDSPVSPAQWSSSAVPVSPVSSGAGGIQIFLAHAKEDEAQVLELYERLRSRGYRPWLDKKDLIAGQNWRNAIPQAIRQSDIFVACLSSRSVGKQGYVQQEFRLALNVLAQKPADTIYLIPLRLDVCEIPDLRQSEYGINMRDYHWLNYFELDGFEQLERAILHQSGQSSSASSSSSLSSPLLSSPLASDVQNPPSNRAASVPKSVSPSRPPSSGFVGPKPRSRLSSAKKRGRSIVDGDFLFTPSPSPSVSNAPIQRRTSSLRSVQPERGGSPPVIPPFSIPLSRRRMIQMMGFTGGCAGVWWLGRILVRLPETEDSRLVRSPEPPELSLNRLSDIINRINGGHEIS